MYVVWMSLFALALGLLLYTYFGYGLALRFLSLIRRPLEVSKGPFAGRVSLVIPAYNEAQAIAGKLDNVLALDFPREQLEVIVVSDASSDGTDEIVSRYRDRGIRLVRQHRRGGKIAAYRRVLPLLTGDIIVFSDATSLLAPQAITRLVENFADPKVGCVGGQLHYVNATQALTGRGERTYWDYESHIRMRESALDSLTSVSGTLYAVRRGMYPANLRDDLADDLIVPLNVRSVGSRVVLEPAAVCVEATTLSAEEEMSKRARITVQNIRGLLSRPDMLNPARYGLFALFLASHKLCRLLVPVFLFLVLASSVVLSADQPLFLALTLLQAAFYAGGFAGYLLRVKALHTLYYFCLSNLAIVVGELRYLRGVKIVTWETMRRTQS